MNYITLHLPRLIFTCYLISHVLSILRVFGYFAVRLHFDRKKKRKKKRSTKLYHLTLWSLPQLVYGSNEQLESH